MTATPTSQPSWKGQPEPVGLADQLLQLLPDELIYDTRQLMPDMTNLKLAAISFENFGLNAPTQADLDAEAKRRTAANRDPQADPAPGAIQVAKAKPGDQGRAQAVKRFGVKQ